MAQLVASMSGVVLGGVVEVVGLNLARGKIFTASIGSVDSLYPSVYIYIYIKKYFLHPCTNTQGGTGLLIALRKGTDQPFKVIGHLLSLIKVCILDQRRL